LIEVVPVGSHLTASTDMHTSRQSREIGVRNQAAERRGFQRLRFVLGIIRTIAQFP
jgi:hypothetical protein